MTGISEPPPFFFFSYSRFDAKRNRFVERFRQELEMCVRSQSRYTGNEALCYHDTSAILDDGHWEPPLLDALTRRCGVLVALYTPQYFARRAEVPCYRGREVGVFRRRGRGNIVPVLWELENGGPEATVPETLHDIDWEIGRDLPEQLITPRSRGIYTTVGLWNIWTGNRQARSNITFDLARRVYRLSKTPLPALTVPVDMFTEDCAFHPGEAAQRTLPAVGGEASPAKTDPRGLTLVYVTEGQVSAENQDLLEKAAWDLGNFVEARRWSIAEAPDALRVATAENRTVLLVSRLRALLRQL